MKLNLTARFTLISSGVLLLIVAVLISLQIAERRSQLQQGLTTKGEDLTAVLVQAAIQPILNYDFMNLEALLTAVANDDKVGYARCFGTDGQPIATAGNQHEMLHLFRADIIGEGGVKLGVIEVGIDNGQYLKQLYSDLFRIIGALLLVGVIIVAVNAMIVNRTVIRPLQAVERTLDNIASGDLMVTFPDDRNDEVGHLFRVMQGMAGRLRADIGQVRSSAERLQQVTAEMARFTRDTLSGTDRQRSETEQVATAITQMNQTVHHVADNANQAAAAARVADEATVAGKQVISETLASIEALAHQTEQAAEVIHRLNRFTESIGGVLNVIQGIAEQTNLLALNAAIEAARAGEQGRGFAVVADEVRTLASRTQESTRQIGSTIEELQQVVREAVTLMSKGAEQAHHSLDYTGAAERALTTITERVTEITVMNEQIAHASREQNSVSEEINRNIINISQIADHTAEGAQETARTGSTLSKMVSDLQAIVAHFKV